MQINATITGIHYKLLFTEKLKQIDFKDFDINTCPSSAFVIDYKHNFAISKWVSPKRTRSYPYERVYNTLISGKKITVIPVIKDEGFDGDRDFVQWDTISLMSLLDVYVILGYYYKAEKNKKYQNKITSQKFDNQFIMDKIKEISTYHSSALHWNLKELNESFAPIIANVKANYTKISSDLGIQMHSEKGIEDFQKVIGKSLKEFMTFSRQKAKEAQNREFVTQQPNESLQTLTKAKITITNYLGGQYFLTVDEIKIEEEVIYLMESKHAKSSVLPTKSDIKDGLLKMILYTNLKSIEVNQKTYHAVPVLLLTSLKLISELNSNATAQELTDFIEKNKLNKRQRELIKNVFEEAITNNFLVIFKHG